MKNFKSWRDSGYVKFGPLTGFFGSNSSGKSSLLQMLLLLKQTVEHPDINEVIFFGNESSYVNLGNFREVIHEHKLVAPLVFELQCQLTHLRSPIKIPEDGSPWEQLMVQFAYESIIRVENGKLIMERLSYGHSLKEVAKIVWSEGRASFPSSTLSNNGETNIQLENCYGKEASGTTESVKVLQKFVSAFEELFSHVFYLGPTRAHPQRHYHWEGSHPKGIGRWGDKTIDALLSARVDRKTILHNVRDVSIEERISDWLREMNLAHTFWLERTEQQDGKEYDVRIQMKEHGPKIALADMGFGLSQFLPVLVLCYYAPEGSTLILEQPGIHLHPKVQSQLADLLIEVVNERKLQILVESHSEHLLTRLQRRIVEEKIAADQTAFYFCRNNEGVSEIEKLDVDEASGDIKNWPENFFGDVMGDMFAMTDKQAETIAETEPEG
jgi:predicted ATPase